MQKLAAIGSVEKNCIGRKENVYANSLSVLLEYKALSLLLNYLLH